MASQESLATRRHVECSPAFHPGVEVFDLRDVAHGIAAHGDDVSELALF
jgi:hypothetical protein